MKKLRSNSVKVEITPIDHRDKPYTVTGKGRNSVSQKVFGVRAYKAVQEGLAKSIRNLD